MNTELRENIDWVGYVDWTVRDFHGYDTPHGATYNAYLVRDEQTALIDTVKAPFAGELIRHIRELIGEGGIDYVVCNHAEPDHASALPQVFTEWPDAVLVCNQKCLKALGEHFDVSGWRTRIITTGDTLKLGQRSLTFIDTPMVHWPESMFTYVPEEGILFSMDAFGQHFATSQRFDDEVNINDVMREAKVYYATIVMPFGKRVAAVLQQAAGLDIKMIATSHGVIWRSHVADIVSAYRNWAVCRPAAKVLVIYDTMWDSTGQMARAIHEGASVAGVQAELLPVRDVSLTRLATELLDAAVVAFGSATLNSGMLPMASAVLTYFKGLNPTGKAGFAFGSYGWGKGGAVEVDECLKEMHWEILREPIRSKYRPTDAVLTECRDAGAMLARCALERAAAASQG